MLLQKFRWTRHWHVTHGGHCCRRQILSKLDILVHLGDTHWSLTALVRDCSQRNWPRVMSKLAVVTKPTTVSIAKLYLFIVLWGSCKNFNASMVEPANFQARRNRFANLNSKTLPHLMNVLDQLGMSLHARIEWQSPSNNISSFSAHKNITYRFLSSSKTATAIDITVTLEPCVFNTLDLSGTQWWWSWRIFSCWTRREGNKCTQLARSH